MSTATMTLLFTDIAASTERALQLGDAHWDTLLTAYRGAVRRELRVAGGREVDTAGDGFFAVFRTPESALDCARSIAVRTDGLGLPSRTGYTSEHASAGARRSAASTCTWPHA